MTSQIKRIGKVVDRTGHRNGLITVVSLHSAPNGRARWNCVCDCGTEKVIPADTLAKGRSKSCGCQTQNFKSKKMTRHGQSRVNGGPSGAYRSWHAALQRCSNPNSHFFVNYGGRGIKFCERWRLFDNFFADMGARPEGHTLDRIDPNGNYEPGNCKWSTPREQSLNQRPKIRNDDISDLLSIAKRILSAGTPFRSELAAAIDKVELRRTV